MMAQIYSKMLKLAASGLRHLNREVIELNNVGELRKIFDWKMEPVLEDPSLHEFHYIEDVNQRRIRDAECLGTVVRNAQPSLCLDIGT